MASEPFGISAEKYVEQYHEHVALLLSLGFKLLALHHPIKGRDGVHCSCGKPDCRHIGKHPFARFSANGHHSATDDGARVSSWIDNAPVNLGIRTGKLNGVIVLDKDPRNGGDENLAALEKQHGELPVTWRVETGGGGEHYFFRHPGFEVSCSKSKIAPGVDIKGDTGFVVAPPSRHESGWGYQFFVDYHPEDIPLADAPDWLLAKIIETRSKGRGPRDWRSEICASYPEGQRNEKIAALAGHLLRKNVDPRATLELMLGWNARHCAPPLDEAEVQKTVASIAKRDIARREGRRD